MPFICVENANLPKFDGPTPFKNSFNSALHISSSEIVPSSLNPLNVYNGIDTFAEFIIVRLIRLVRSRNDIYDVLVKVSSIFVFLLLAAAALPAPGRLYIIPA